MSRYWCFTLNNYSGEDIERLSSKIDGLDYMIFGKEVGDSGTPHLQGYFEVKTNKTMLSAKKFIGISGMHLEQRKASRISCINYCKKGGQSHDEWNNYHEDGDNYGMNAEWLEFEWYKKSQGKRNDLKKENSFSLINKLAKDGKSFTEIADFNPEIAIKNHSGIKNLINEYKIQQQKELVKSEMENVTLLDWQDKLAKELSGKPDSRRMIWYVDTKGGCGKSTFTRWLYVNMECLALNNAKTNDIAKAWNGEKIVIFDLARCTGDERVNYQAMEYVKNGQIFSGKYESQSKFFQKPHVVIFANWPPSRGDLNMSDDKWDIRYLNPDTDGPSPLDQNSVSHVNQPD